MLQALILQYTRMEPVVNMCEITNWEVPHQTVREGSGDAATRWEAEGERVHVHRTTAPRTSKQGAQARWRKGLKIDSAGAELAKMPANQGGKHANICAAFIRKGSAWMENLGIQSVAEILRGEAFGYREVQIRVFTYTPIESPRTTDEQTLTDWGDRIMERHANDVPAELRDEAVQNVLQPWSADIRSRELGLELLKEELELIAEPLQKLTAKLSRVQQAGSSKRKGQPKPKEITAWGAEQRQLTKQSKAMRSSIK